ncbi:MAG: hypothetical protein ACFHU9_08655 [Fluviicola sp.]
MRAKVLEKRIMILRILVCLFFVIGIGLSFKVWHTDRLFPVLPVFDWMPSSTDDISGFLAVILVFGLLLGTVIRSRKYFIGLFVLLIFLLLQDQMRWQPWVYIYVAFLFPFALWKKVDESLLPYFQFLLIGIYLWSGAFKFGGSFIELTWDKMLRTLLYIDDSSTRQSLHFLGYGIPIMEILIAIGLFFKKSRHVAILFAVITHIIILIYVITNQQNSVIYPWNFAMIFLVVLCFYEAGNSMVDWVHLDSARCATSDSARCATSDSLQLAQGGAARRAQNKQLESNTSSNQDSSNIAEQQSSAVGNKVKLQIASGALFFLLLPALNPLGLWDNYLSFHLYSGTNGAFCVGLDQDQYKKIDPELYEYFWAVDEPNGKFWIYVNLWALEELNVAFYPEERTFKELAKSFCGGDIPSEKLEFVIYRDGFKRKGATIFECECITQ